MAAEVKISDLPASASLDGSEIGECVQAGKSVKWSLGDKYDSSNPANYVALAQITDAIIMAKLLTGLSVSGSTIANGISLITALGRLQNQINALVGGITYQGTWNANTNSPALASGVGTKGYQYRVSVTGATTIDGINDWVVGDWIVYNGTAWEKIDNTDKITSVNGLTGVVVLGYSDVSAAPSAPIQRTGTSVQFDNEATYGSAASPETGNITVNSTSAQNYITQLVIHQNGSSPTYPGTFVLMSGTYNTGKNNFIYIERISSTLYHYWITQEP